MDKWHPQHVQRVLVDQLRTPATLDFLRYHDEVALAQLVAIQLAQDAQVGEDAWIVPTQFVGKTVEERVLVHRLQCRMRIQHLFEQGRSGTRKADNEDRRIAEVRSG